MEKFLSEAQEGGESANALAKLGLSAAVDPWVYLARGLHNEQVEPDGTIVGSMRDEIPQRGQLRQWKALMEQAA